MLTHACFEAVWPDKVLMKYQYWSDFIIALAYFFIALELLYFASRSIMIPFKRVLVLFGAFFFLCGATHFLNLWTFSTYSILFAKLMAVAKFSTALVSCVTALMLVQIIPELLAWKRREDFLKHRVEELDREKGLVIREEESLRQVGMLIHDIRSTLDKNTILNTTMIKLGNVLDLAECALWVPSRTGLNMVLMHTLSNLILSGYHVPIHVPIIDEVFSSAKAIRVPQSCPLSRIRPDVETHSPPEVVAIRIPLLHPSNFHVYDGPEITAKSYAILVLILPLDGIRRWCDHELDLIEVVADQVAGGLSHAEVLEDSLGGNHQLMDQNHALKLARKEVEMEIHARNVFLTVLSREMRTPMDAMFALSSLLLETELSPDQRMMLETILKRSDILEALIDDVLDFSRLIDGTLQLDRNIFNLHTMFKEVINLIKPIASAKDIKLYLTLGMDLPEYAVGDEICLVQVILGIVGNAVKFTDRGGFVDVDVSITKPEYLESWQASDFCPVASDEHFYLLVQIIDGFASDYLTSLFTKFSESQTTSDQNNNNPHLGLAICKRYIELMGGKIAIESEGVDMGTTVTFVVKVGLGNYSNEALEHVVPRG